MFSFRKNKQSEQKSRAFGFKGVNRVLLSVILVIFAMIFTSQSIRAQIESLYEAQGDVAGINALMSAVVSNDVNGVKFFSKAGRALINQKNIGGATALHLACREGNFEIAKTLIDSGANINATDNEGWTPLMRASLAGQAQIVEFLLARDAQANFLNSVGESAIIHATTSNCNECLGLMFEKFNFIRAMDIRILKEQLTDAFVVARNRENKAAQDLIEAYLDQVIKMAPLVEKEKSAEKKLEEVPETIFKITSAEAPKPAPVKVPMVAKQEEKRAVVQTAAPAKETKPTYIPKVEKRESEALKKFKLIAGAPACAPIIAPQEEPAAEKKFTIKKAAKEPKEVIFLVKQPKKETVVVSQVGDKVFKFNEGPKGQAIKYKPKPVEAEQPKVEIKVETKIIEPKKTETKAEVKKPEAKPVVTVKVEQPKPAAAPAPAAAAKPLSPQTKAVEVTQSPTQTTITTPLPAKVEVKVEQPKAPAKPPVMNGAKYVIGVFPEPKPVKLVPTPKKTEKKKAPAEKVYKTVIIDPAKEEEEQQ